MHETVERVTPAAGDRIRPAAFEHPALGLVRDYLEENVARPLTLGIAAGIARLNPKYFSALFHERVGVRFIDWLHLVRTERARRLLEDTHLPIAEIAVRVGYRDLRTFERAFKKCHGRTAQRYRRQCGAVTPGSRPAPGPEAPP